MRVKNVLTNETTLGVLTRSQLCLPQILLSNPNMVIELDEKTIIGLWSMYNSYKHEKGEALTTNVAELEV